MEARPRLLLVEDNPLYAQLIRQGLAEQFDIEHVETGEEALTAVARQAPDVILLDVVLPGQDGYSVCQTLRQGDINNDVPVIFVSGKDAMEDRLAGYEAGGDDFLVKPVPLAELRQKIAVVLRHAELNRSLRSNADSAFRTAMTAMSSAAELGVVLHFFRETFAAVDVPELARRLLGAMTQLGLESSVQLRSRFGAVNLNTEGLCSPLEISILDNLCSAGRIVDLGPRTAINYDRITLIARNMPRDDSDRYGRLRDALALLAEGVDARLMALDNEQALRQHNEALQEMATRADKVRRDLHFNIGQLDIRHAMQLRKLVGDTSEAIVFLGLSKHHSNILRQVMDTANEQVDEVSDLHLAIKKDIELLMQTIRDVAA